MGLGEIRLGEMGLGEMGLGEMGQNPQSAVRPMRLLSSIRLCDSTAFLSIHPPIFICSRNFKLHITCRSVFCSAMKRRQKTTKDNKRRQTTAKDDKKTAKFAVFWRLLPSFARQWKDDKRRQKTTKDAKRRQTMAKDDKRRQKTTKDSKRRQKDSKICCLLASFAVVCRLLSCFATDENSIQRHSLTFTLSAFAHTVFLTCIISLTMESCKRSRSSWYRLCCSSIVSIFLIFIDNICFVYLNYKEHLYRLIAYGNFFLFFSDKSIPTAHRTMNIGTGAKDNGDPLPLYGDRW